MRDEKKCGLKRLNDIPKSHNRVIELELTSLSKLRCSSKTNPESETGPSAMMTQSAEHTVQYGRQTGQQTGHQQSCRCHNGLNRDTMGTSRGGTKLALGIE